MARLSKLEQAAIEKALTVCDLYGDTTDGKNMLAAIRELEAIPHLMDATNKHIRCSYKNGGGMFELPKLYHNSIAAAVFGYLLSDRCNITEIDESATVEEVLKGEFTAGSVFWRGRVYYFFELGHHNNGTHLDGVDDWRWFTDDFVSRQDFAANYDADNSSNDV